MPTAIVLVAGPQRMGGVLDHQCPVPPGDRLDRRQVGRLAGEIDRDDHLRLAAAAHRFQGRGVKAGGTRVDIGEARDSAAVGHAIG